MKYRLSRGQKIFNIINITVLSLVCLFVILLFLHILALSFSDNTAIVSNQVRFLPVGFHIESYKMLFSDQRFLLAFWISIKRVLIGVSVNMLMIILIAYPLSKHRKEFKMRNIYMWYFFITALFSGGIISMFVLLNDLNMLNTIWSLVLPTSVPVFNVILVLNFFRQLPKEIFESAEIDGANEFQKLIRIALPISKPVLATVLLFSVVGHWNSWFDGILFSTTIDAYPLQSYLQTIVIREDYASAGITDPDSIAMLSNTSMKTAQIIVGMIPVLLLYPFLQRYFMSGIVLGSVKE
jgi:putative aldouronate transport system permease protein